MTLHRTHTLAGPASTSNAAVRPVDDVRRPTCDPAALGRYAEAPCWVEYVDHCVCTLWHPLGPNSGPYLEAARRLVRKGFTVRLRAEPPPTSTYLARAGLLPRGRR